MAKCIQCKEPKASYEHFNGGYVCEGCIGSYFTCPGCGRLFDLDDYQNGDQGNGFCRECTEKE